MRNYTTNDGCRSLDVSQDSSAGPVSLDICGDGYEIK